MDRFLLVASVLAWAGCGGDDTGAIPDAATNLPLCTGVAYDPCTDTAASSDCTGGSGLTCRLFMGDGFTVCTPTCDGSTPCPNDKNGNPVTCNMMGRCKASPNACMR